MMGGCSRILLAAMSFAAHAAAGEGELWQQQQRVTAAAPARASRGNSYVFLQKFPLEGTDDLLFHTEILICPSKNFIAEDQQALDKQIVLLQDFVEIDESWWSTRTANCVELGYGGDSCTERCCSVPHGPEQNSYVLNERRAMIKNAKTDEKQLYLYGAGAMDGNAAFHATCDRKCWSNWKGTDYNPLTNNCNTFTSTVLHCIFGLSEKKPDLGVSDLVTVTCDKCPEDVARGAKANDLGLVEGTLFY